MRVRAPWIKACHMIDNRFYAIPNFDVLILGGTAYHGNWNAEVSEQVCRLAPQHVALVAANRQLVSSRRASDRVSLAKPYVAPLCQMSASATLSFGWRLQTSDIGCRTAAISGRDAALTCRACVSASLSFEPTLVFCSHANRQHVVTRAPITLLASAALSWWDTGLAFALGGRPSGWTRRPLRCGSVYASSAYRVMACLCTVQGRMTSHNPGQHVLTCRLVLTCHGKPSSQREHYACAD